MTKQQLQQWIMSAAMVLTGISAFWLWGPLAWVKPMLSNLATLLTAIAGNDAILDAIVAMFASGQLSLPHPPHQPSQHQLAMVTKPTEKHLNEFVDSAPPSMIA